jgi:hypothetical protein
MRKVDILAALLLVPVCGYVFYESARWPVPPDLGDPAWIPRGVAACLLGAAGLLFVRAWQDRSLPAPPALTGPDRARVLWVVVLTGAYVILLERVGFIATTTPYLFGFGAALGERRWVRLAVFALLVSAAIYLLFDTTLHVPLPRGLLR